MLSIFVDVVKDKEVECGGAPPRVLVLDDYFMTEVEKVEKDPDTGRRVKNKVSPTCNNNSSAAKVVLKSAWHIYYKYYCKQFNKI